MKLTLAGLGRDGRPVISGADVFALMDTQGVHLSASIVAMERYGLAFDVVGFLEAGEDSPNWGRQKTFRLLREEAPATAVPALEWMERRAD